MPNSTVDIRQGTIWTILWWGFKLSQKFISNVILTRLLPPEVFGIASVGNAIVAGASMLSDFGIRQSIVRTARTDGAFYQTAWTVQLFRGVALMAVILILAMPIEAAYETQGLGAFIAAVAISFLAMGLNNIEVHRDYRHATMRRLALIDNVSALVGLITMIVWAWVSPGYLALAAGAVVSTLTTTAATYFAYPRSNCRFRLDKSSLEELIVFGRWAMVSTIFAFVTLQIDKLVLGKLVTMQVLGLYSIAWLWASMPNQILGQWAESVFYPLVAQQLRNNNGKNLEWMARRLLVAIAAALSIFIYAVADVLVDVIYSAEYQGVAPMLRQLALVVLIYTVDQSYSHFLVAQARLKEKVVGQAFSVVMFMLLVAPCYRWAALDGIIFLLAACSAVRVLWMAYLLNIKEIRFDALAVGSFVALAPLLHSLNTVQQSLLYRIPVASIEGVIVGGIALLCYGRLKRASVEV